MKIKVNTFINEIPIEYREKFIKLMKEWDGSNSVGYAFYDLDVLKMKYEEAKGINNG